MPPRHQTFDSNGPNVRIRGNAHQVHEKYLALARDAASAGDRIAAENYYQHAEHYFRIIAADQAEAEQRNAQQPNPPQGFGSNGQQNRAPRGRRGNGSDELDASDGPGQSDEGVPTMADDPGSQPEQVEPEQLSDRVIGD